MRFQTAVLARLLRRALIRRLRQSSLPSDLFYPVCLAFAGGLIAAVDASSEAPGFALDSVLLYRAEVGLAFMGALYIVGMLLWLAWHGKGFFELGGFGLTVKASAAEEAEVTEAYLTGTGKQILKFQTVATNGLEDLDARLSALEERSGLCRSEIQARK